MNHSVAQQTKNRGRYRGDASRFRPRADGFRCYETVVKEDENDALIDNDDNENDPASVLFHCTQPSEQQQPLIFRCREPSCGVLVGDEPRAIKNDDDDSMDPFFFDTGYTLAATTGWTIWAGTRLLVEVLLWPLPRTDCDKLQTLQHQIVHGGARIIELGAGIGVSGTCLAAAGAQVLLTDLPTLVDHAIRPNLIRNKNAVSVANEQQQDDDECPQWLDSVSSNNAAVRIGRGWANTTALDWTKPLGKQLIEQHIANVDLIVASDCVWLADLLDSFFSTVAAIFAVSSQAKLLVSFQPRDSGGSNNNVDNTATRFTSVDGFLAMVKDHQWEIDCLAWRPVENEADKDLFVFEITPSTNTIKAGAMEPLM